MKKLFLLTAYCLLLTVYCFSQAPEKINYQGVARNLNGDVLTSQAIGLRITLHSSSPNGTTVYQEAHNTSTNNFGLFNIQLGGGTVLAGIFNTIDWGSGLFYIQTEMDANGGVNYQNLGTSQFVSVPYALYAKTSGTPGTPGATGVTGATGNDGTTGATGLQGSVGPNGPTGNNGTNGATCAT